MLYLICELDHFSLTFSSLQCKSSLLWNATRTSNAKSQSSLRLVIRIYADLRAQVKTILYGLNRWINIILIFSKLILWLLAPRGAIKLLLIGKMAILWQPGSLLPLCSFCQVLWPELVFPKPPKTRKKNKEMSTLVSISLLKTVSYPSIKLSHVSADEDSCVNNL